MKVFISYGSLADQVTALRLQALAAVNGLTVYVPPAYSRQNVPAVLEPETHEKLNDADVLLGVVGGTGLTEACTQELNTGIALQKKTIIMSDPLLALQLQPHFGSNLVVIDPANPDQAETDIVRYLKTVDAEKNVKNALLALGTLWACSFLLLPIANSSHAGAPLYHRQFLRHRPGSS